MNGYDGSNGLSEAWDDEFDVVVVGFGYAGSVAAIEACDAGSTVLLVEKMPDPGGISVCSGGNVRVAEDADKAFHYLRATNAGTTPDDVILALAEGMTQVPAYFEHLATVNNATTESRPSPGNYPFPGADTFQYLSIGSIPGFDPAEHYSYVSSYLPMHRAAGIRLFKVIEDNIARRGIAVWLNAPARRLITNDRAEVCGVTVETGKGHRRVKAKRAVILACGGFEADEEMKLRYWQEKPVMSAAFLGNTGDGIRMAQDVGADLWHMWHYHGTYGFRHPEPDYPYGVRLKRLPDWVPGRSSRDGVRVPFILLDQKGRRYMNEYQPYTQDTSQRPMALFDPLTQTYPRIPSFLVLDESTRRTYPLCSPTFNDRNYRFEYTEENLKALEERIVTRVDNLDGLAEAINVDVSELKATLERWNSMCERGSDTDFGRTAPSMMKIEKPPFYYAEVWPMVQNTHGGPVHNVHQQVLDGYGEPIPRLYAAGELGGVFGHLYLGGGNLAECFVGGWTAGRHAAHLDLWN